ncbi:hypothetical protein SMSP2_02261 [Limihaloglobus sulfuriphilus]|uniref:Ice-binding protein C-terminal domain-containing protein n=1 Tax=Limihaloglobus sulfuriphilus TaxID=1851148 RepID=A0A1Q2MHZ7_9BACT|nr:PEP-CTERM sorting domain-containing protein [Limihaloglobus sulfuriphilus]AQQ71882.1 hypothetical protein SMSP2_02261 [Limihaloglobus sulfuriphilus]
MKKFLAALCAAIMVTGSFAYTVDYGWETGSQAYLGTYGSIDTVNTGFNTDVARTGTQSLKIVEDPLSSTPQVYVGWVTGVSEGDVITATGWMYSTSADAAVSNPRGRLWCHYSTAADITTYEGSGTNPNNDYAGTVDWMQFTQSTTVATGKEAVVIEARIYSDPAPGNVIYLDDLQITAPEGALVTLANGTTVPEPATMAVMALGGIFAFRKRR